MRAQGSSDGLTAQAVAGNHVVIIGWDLPEDDIRATGVLGFSIQRHRHSDGEVKWLSGMKTFESVDPDPDLGAPVSSFHHPIQSFQWADYSVAPNQTYTYRVVARTGLPGALTDGPEVTLTVTTEPIDQGKHAVFFNRGAVASQEYARRFLNKPPDEWGQAAFDWLSRGLVESLETFIAQANAGDELLGAFFEFENTRIFAALEQAVANGVTVNIIYDGDTQLEGNDAAIHGRPIEAHTQARTRSGQFAHNKFLILRRGGVSAEVWTGSTNLTQNGIFGHSNNAHLVRDAVVAEQYFKYWQILDKDETRKPTATAATALSPAPPSPPEPEVTAVFSPRLDLAALDWYAQMAGQAQRALFMTFAFGMNSRFVNVYDQTDDVLRFALMEKKGNGKTFKEQAAEIDRIRRRPNTTIAVGHRVTVNAFDRWLQEIDQIVDDAHVLFVHTKYMLIDPLGPSPIVVVGSANFSVSSTDTNDENMLVIKGNSAIADIYLGEFMRLFSHYAFRESLKFKTNLTDTEALKRKFLKESSDWIDGEGPNAGYFAPGSDRSLRRLYFSGQ